MNQESLPSANARDSMWSIFPRLWVIYFTLFTVLYLSSLSFVVWYEAAQRTNPSVYDVIYATILKLALVGGGAAITSFVITEGGRLSMIMARYFELHVLEPKREKIRAEARTKARAEGRAEGHAEGRAEGHSEYAEQMQEWNRRRLDAEARGEPFDEPLPDLTQP